MLYFHQREEHLQRSHHLLDPVPQPRLSSHWNLDLCFEVSLPSSNSSFLTLYHLQNKYKLYKCKFTYLTCIKYTQKSNYHASSHHQRGHYHCEVLNRCYFPHYHCCHLHQLLQTSYWDSLHSVNEQNC